MLEGKPSSNSWQRDTDTVAELLLQVMNESVKDIKIGFVTLCITNLII